MKKYSRTTPHPNSVLGRAKAAGDKELLEKYHAWDNDFREQHALLEAWHEDEFV